MRHVRTPRCAHMRLGARGFDPAHCPRQVHDCAPRDQMHGPRRRRPSHTVPGQAHDECSGQCFEDQRGVHGQGFTVDPDVDGIVRGNLESWVVHSNQPG